MYAIIL